MFIKKVQQSLLYKNLNRIQDKIHGFNFSDNTKIKAPVIKIKRLFLLHTSFQNFYNVIAR